MSAGPSMSLVDRNTSVGGVGNYKGVMLCNRPFAGVEPNSKTTSQADKSSFRCGVVSESVGANVSINNLFEKTHVKRPKKETALTKHRKWLAELQATKDRLETQYVEENQRKIEELQKFTEREQKMRQLARESTNSSSEAKLAEDQAKSIPESKSPEKKKGMKMPKPAWALSKEAADEKSEEKISEEDAELIEFAKGLDFDKYIDDLEMQTMIDKVKKRVTELEREVVDEKQREEEYELRQELKLQAKDGGDENLSNNIDGNNNNNNGGDDMYAAAAKTLLSETDDFKNIHSTKSIAAIVKSTVTKGGDKKALNEPIIVTHQVSEGRLENQHTINKLPYMNRNPAV